MIHSSIIENKHEVTAFSRFKRRLSSVMAFAMSRNFLFLISAVVLLALAACGRGEDEQAAAPVQPEQTTSTPVQEEQTGPDLIKAMQDNSGVLTPEQQAAAVERARKNAEAAAKSVGQNEQQAQAAGDAAASAAQQSFATRQITQ